MYEQVMDNFSDGITIQDRDFNIIYQNHAMQQAFGDRIGARCYAVYEERDHVCEGCGLLTVFETGESTMVHRTAITETGVASNWENSCFPLLDDHGNIVAGVEVCRDVTNRAMPAEEVKERNIELGRLNDLLNRQTCELEESLVERDAATESLLREVDDHRRAEEKAIRAKERADQANAELEVAMFNLDLAY